MITKSPYPASILRVILTLLFLLLINTFLKSEIRYVSKTGSSTPPYTSWATAADSIMKAINISNFGDTIYVANGIYKEKVVMIQGLALIGSGSDSCIIDTRQFPPPGNSVKVKDSCLFQNFRILAQPPDQGGTGMAIGGYGAQVKFNKIENAETGIWCFETNAKVKKNMIINLSQSLPGNGIRVDLNAPVLDSNIIYVNGFGIGLSLNSRASVVNNLIVLEDRNASGDLPPEMCANNKLVFSDSQALAT